jgi:hypothetical protein
MRTAVLASLLALTVAGLLPGPAVAQTLQPLVVDWAQYFRVESEPGTRGGRPVVTGKVWNTAPWGAKKIQLLVDALDAGGRVVDQRVAWLGIDLVSGSHAAFEVPMPAAASYRVSVFAFESGRGGRWS